MRSPSGSDLLQEGHELVTAANAEGLAVRLLGGVGIRLLVGDAFDEAFARPYADIDLFASRRDARALEKLIEGRGWVPARQFNALNGARRLLFHEPSGASQIDVFVDVFEMCHSLPLADGLNGPPPTLPASDLLMTKLQIVELNAKDRGDLYALLSGAPVGETVRQRGIDPGRVAELTGRDWGLHHTFEINLSRLAAGLAEVSLPAGGRAVIEASVSALVDAMEAAPKSRGWRMRARVGERKAWYQPVEEVAR